MNDELNKIEREFLSIDIAIESAFDNLIEKAKIQGTDNSSVYIWRQRYKNGKLSHKKISEILEEAGFKKVVEEKWILINKPQRIPQASTILDRDDRGKKQTKGPKRKALKD